jgi:hypothetical protein
VLPVLIARICHNMLAADSEDSKCGFISDERLERHLGTLSLDPVA